MTGAALFLAVVAQCVERRDQVGAVPGRDRFQQVCLEFFDHLTRFGKAGCALVGHDDGDAAPIERFAPDQPLLFERIEQFIKWDDIRMLLVKSSVFGLIVSTICCKKGYYASGGARGVGEATAKAVVASIVAIFAADYVTTSIMTEL